MIDIYLYYKVTKYIWEIFYQERNFDGLDMQV